MNKESYERTDIEIIRFQTMDVIMVSKPLEEDDEFHEKMH